MRCVTRTSGWFIESVQVRQRTWGEWFIFEKIKIKNYMGLGVGTDLVKQFPIHTELLITNLSSRGYKTMSLSPFKSNDYTN